jgi:hypothetical protein
MLADVPPEFYGLAVMIFCLTVIMAIVGLGYMIRWVLFKWKIIKNDDKDIWNEDDYVDPRD